MRERIKGFLTSFRVMLALMLFSLIADTLGIYAFLQNSQSQTPLPIINIVPTAFHAGGLWVIGFYVYLSLLHRVWLTNAGASDSFLTFI